MFGIRVPSDIKEALLLNNEKQNELWKEAFRKELMKIWDF